MKCIKTSAFALAAIIAAPALADPIVNDGAIIDYYQIAYYSPLAQTFTAIDANLQSIGFNYTVMNSGYSNTPITLALYEGAGTGGTLLASRTFDLVNLYGFTDTDFSGITLGVGQVYTAAVSTSSPLMGIYVTGDSYSGGYLNTGVYGAQSDLDLSFRVIGGSAAGPVPEPASWALMLGGFGFMGGALRRQRLTRVRFV
ncbi:PEPxxWA-CTERM sorting domain-containing protein [Sphingomonas sp. RS6]